MRTRTTAAVTLLFTLFASSVIPPNALADPSSPDPIYRSKGYWDAAYDWGKDAIHLILQRSNTKHSQLMFWEEHDTSVRIWRFDPGDVLGSPLDTVYAPTGRMPLELFCSGHVSLADGRTLMVGGTDDFNMGINHSNIFDPSTGYWKNSPFAAPMTYPRWYPTATMLPDGDVLVTSGSMASQAVGFGGQTGSGTSSALHTLLGLQRGLTTLNPALAGSSPPEREWHTAIFDPSALGTGPSGWEPARRMVLYGGANEDSVLGSVWALYTSGYSNTMNWRQLPVYGDSLPAARYRHAGVYETGSKSMIIVGGIRHDGAILMDTWRYHLDHPDSGKWVRIAVGDTVPPARYGHTCVYDTQRNRLLLFGGSDGTQYFADLWALSLTGPTVWTRLTQSAERPTAREGHTAHYWVAPHLMAVFGGGRSDSLFNQAWLLRVQTGQWKLIPNNSNPPVRRLWHASILSQTPDELERVIVSGGDTNGATVGGEQADVWVWRLSDTTFVDWVRAVETLPTGARARHSLVHDTRRNWAVIPERYHPSGSTGSWTAISSLARKQPWYPLMFVLPSGKLLYAGPSDSTYMTDLTDTYPSWTSYSWAVSGSVNGSAAMYLPGQVMKSGGSSSPSVSTRWIDLSGAPDTAQWRASGNMNRPRKEHNLTILPTGDVLVTGGFSGVSESTSPARRPQYWRPAVNAWSDSLAEEPVNRGYHSTAVLLPDGRVLSAGGEYGADDEKATIFYPPYLFKANGTMAARPGIEEAPYQISYGDTFNVCTVSAATSIAKVVLMRPGAATHGFNQDQRYVPLQFQTGTGEACHRLKIAEPPNANIAPPGLYMMFIVKSDSVPSYAEWILVGDTREELIACLACDGLQAGGEEESSLPLEASAADSPGSVAASEASVRFALERIYPNPSPNTITIAYASPRAQPAILEVFDLAGRRICTLLRGEVSAGRYSATWDGTDSAGRSVGNGLYFCRYRAGGEEATARFTVLRH